MKWFQMSVFHAKNYTFYSIVENGDLNWIIPDRFLAFSTPMDERIVNGVSYKL
jgi:cell division cycle 14